MNKIVAGSPARGDCKIITFFNIPNFLSSGVGIKGDGNPMTSYTDELYGIVCGEFSEQNGVKSQSVIVRGHCYSANLQGITGEGFVIVKTGITGVIIQPDGKEILFTDLNLVKIGG